MEINLLGVVLLGLMLAAPLIVERYLRQLPVAPACPRCRSVARQTERAYDLFDRLPAFGRTFVAECIRCGWRGRMKWRWARHAVDPQRRS